MGDISPDDMARIHIRKEKEPFREVTFGDGSKGRVWCTFTEKQIDLNYNSPKTKSEEHTSELQSLMRTSYAVFCLKKKQRLHHRLRITSMQPRHKYAVSPPHYL